MLVALLVTIHLLATRLGAAPMRIDFFGSDPSGWPMSNAILPSRMARGTPCQVATRQVEIGSLDNPAATPMPRVRFEGAVLLVDGRPWFPRAIEYSGEPFAELHRLGFNSVILQQLATADQRVEARKAGLWIICPPPSADRLKESMQTNDHDVVLAWHLGTQLSKKELPGVQSLIKALRRHDPWPGRPIVGQPVAEHQDYSRNLDVIILNCPDPCHMTPAEYFDWLSRHQSLARPGTVHWSVVPTRPSATIREQVALIAEPLGRFVGLSAEITCELIPRQMEQTAFVGLASGVRGLCFHSDLPFVENGISASPRNAEIELLNQTLGVLDSLWAEGQPVHGSFGLEHECVSELRSTPRAQVLIRSSPLSYPNRAENTQRHGNNHLIPILVPGIPEASRVVRWSVANLELLPHRRAAGGMRVEIREPQTNELLLFTRDENLISNLRRYAAAVMQRRIFLAEQLVQSGHKPGNVYDASSLNMAMERLVQSATSAESIVAGGAFERLAPTRAAGWRHVESPAGGILTGMEITHDRMREGRGCLHMFAAAVDGCRPGMPPVWIVSPPIPLAAGDLVRISGWLDVEMAADRRDGLIVSDSIGGRPLALQFSTTKGWKSFEFHRLAPRTESMYVTFALAGIGDVWLDDVRIEKLSVPEQKQITAEHKNHLDPVTQ